MHEASDSCDREDYFRHGAVLVAACCDQVLHVLLNHHCQAGRCKHLYDALDVDALFCLQVPEEAQYVAAVGLEGCLNACGALALCVERRGAVLCE
eukprot:4924743-Prymnesium_polylepis.1